MDWSKARFKIGSKGSKSAIFTPAMLQVLILCPGHINPGETSHAGAWVAGAAFDRIGQNRRQQRRLARRQAGSRATERIGRARLRAELSRWPELGNIQ